MKHKFRKCAKCKKELNNINISGWCEDCGKIEKKLVSRAKKIKDEMEEYVY